MISEWESAFSQLTYGIYILTTKYQERINGMIASWVSQVSYEPPLIMVAVHPNRYTHQLLEKSGVFALHSLLKHQKDYLVRFKSKDPDAKFSGIKWRNGKTECPILSECASYFECRVVSKFEPGNHTLFIGNVVEAGHQKHQGLLNTSHYDGVYLGKR